MNLIALTPKNLAVGFFVMSVSVYKPLRYKNLETLHLFTRLTNTDGLAYIVILSASFIKCREFQR